MDNFNQSLGADVMSALNESNISQGETLGKTAQDIFGDFGVDPEEQQWREQRLGKITGSNFAKFVKQDRKGGYMLSTGKVAEDLMYRIAWERLLKQGNISHGLGRLSINSQSIQHGNDFEEMAILKYEQEKGITVERGQKFIELNDFIGGTPDGFIGDDGIIEAKCPFNGGNHLKCLLTKEIYNSDHLYQVHGYLWVTGRKWCDYITYDPDLIDELQLNVIRVERDEEIIEGIRQVMEVVKERITEIMNHEKLKA